MFKRMTWFLVLILMALAIPAAAQDDATCERIVNGAFAIARSVCAETERDQMCYVSAPTSAVPRYLTTDFVFERPGDRLDIDRVESVTTGALNTAQNEYGVVYAQLGGNLPADGDVILLTFGNTFVANNALPLLEVQLTANTLVNVQAEPTDLSETVGTLVVDQGVTANARTGDPLLVTDATWVRIGTENGVGWIPANTVTEDYLLPSLTTVDPTQPAYAPMQSMTILSGGTDRGCAGVPDSGALIQTGLRPIALVVNQAMVELKPNTTLFVQGIPNATLDLYALEGGIQVMAADVAQTASAGQVIQVPLGLDSLAGGAPNPAIVYPNAKVTPLQLATITLPRTTIAAAGSDAPLAAAPVVQAPPANPPAVPDEVAAAPSAGSEVVVPDASSEVVTAPPVAEEVAPPPSAGEEVAPVPAAPVVAEEVAPPPSAGGAAPAAVDVGASSALAEAIRAQGTIRIGVNGNLPTFSFRDDGGNYSGFEIELARELVRRLFGDGVQIAFVDVSARQRDTVLAEGRADLLIRNSEFLPERETWGEWSNAFYFIDGQRLMVQAGSEIDSVGDLTGRTVGVQAGTPQQTLMDELALEGVFTVQPVQGIITELVAQLDSGAVDAITADWTVLEAVRTAAENPDGYRVVGDPLTNIPWSVVVPPGETGFRDEVDAALLSVINDGTWLTIYANTFGDDVPDLIQVLFSPGAAGSGGTVVEAVPAEEVAAAPAAPAGEVAQPPAAAPESAPESDLVPVSGSIPVTIFTAENQRRNIVITPSGDGSFLLELVRNGEVVYDARYRFYENTGRWENELNSFEYLEFSDTAGQDGLDCNREPDVRGFFNGANFEGRQGC